MTAVTSESAAAAPLPARHRARWLRITAVLFGCAAILAFRRPDFFRCPQFWAEDGFFYLWAATHGWPSLFEQYAGYLHTIPRLVALSGAHLPARWAPTVFVGSSLLLTLYTAARTQSRRSPLSVTIFSAFAVVLVPDAFEVLLTITNLQWVLAAAFVLVLIARDPERPAQWLHDVIATALLGLTGPFSVLLAPLFVLRAVSRRTRASVVLAVLCTACAVVQAWIIVTHPTPMPGDHVTTNRLLAAPGMRIAGSLFAGAWVPPDYSLPIETLLGIATLLGAALLATRNGPQRGTRAVLGLALLGVLASSLYRCKLVLPDLCHAGYGARYFFPMQLIVLWLLVSWLGDTRRGARIAAAVALIWIVAVNVPRYREPGLADKDWPTYARRIEAGEHVVAPINPDGWTIDVPARPASLH